MNWFWIPIKAKKGPRKKKGSKNLLLFIHFKAWYVFQTHIENDWTVWSHSWPSWSWSETFWKCQLIKEQQTQYMLEPFHHNYPQFFRTETCNWLSAKQMDRKWNFWICIADYAIKSKLNMNSNVNRPWPSIRPTGMDSNLGFNPHSWDYMSPNFLESNKRITWIQAPLCEHFVIFHREKEIMSKNMLQHQISSEKHTDPGMKSRRFPPAFMLRIPSSSPLITCFTI